jgi:hypothetical protein
MSRISKFASGIASLVGLRDGGAIPGDFAETIAPTIEMRDLFLLNYREFFITDAVAAPAVGANFYATDLIVPPTELWYVWSYHITVTAGAGAACDACPGIILDGCPTLLPLSPYQAAAATQQCKTGTNTPFFAGPGSRFGALVRSVTLVPNIYGAAVYTRLRV